MWILRSLKDRVVCYSLVPGQTYKVGRINVDVEVRGDINVSRVHCQFYVRSDCSIKDYRSEVIFEDLGSKYGSYVGEAAIASSQTQDPDSVQPSQKDQIKVGEKMSIQPGTRIRLGLLSSLFKLEWKRMIVCTSTLKEGEKEDLKQTLLKIGIGNHLLVNDWSKDVTHLVMNQVTLTIKVTNALSKAIPVVTPSFFKDLLTCQNTKQQLPDPNMYVPPWSEKSISSEGLILTTLKDRRKIFQGKLFAFGSESQLLKFEHCIKNGGGQVVVFGSPESNYKDPKMFENANNLLVQKEPSFVTDPSNQTQVKLFAEAEAVIAKRGFKTIPMSAIGLAILHCSTAVHCNPDKLGLSESKSLETESSVQPNELVPETQRQTAFLSNPESQVDSIRSFIPETLPSPKNDRPGGMFKEPFAKVQTNLLSKPVKKLEKIVTSTPTNSQSSVESFSWTERNTESLGEEAANFWEISAPQKRKTESLDSPAAKRYKEEKIVEETNRKTTPRLEMSDILPSTPGYERRKDEENNPRQEEVMDTNLPEDTAILEKANKGKKRGKWDDNDSENNERYLQTKIQRNHGHALLDPKLASDESLQSEVEKKPEEIYKDPFGFIEKSARSKPESNDSTELEKDIDNSEVSKSYVQVRTVSLVVESSFGHLHLNGSSRPSLNVTESSVKRFRKQTVVGTCDNPVACVHIENEEVISDGFVQSDESQAQIKTLDTWLTREDELREDERTSNEVWSFALSQDKTMARKFRN